MDLRIDQWIIEVRPWGWIRLSEASGEGATVYLHYAIAGGPGQERLDLQAVVMRSGSGEALSGRIWRRIPLTEIERSLSATLIALPNNPPSEAIGRGAAQAREAFADGIPDVAPPSLDSLDDFFDATKEYAALHFNPMPSGMLVSEGEGRMPHIKPPEGRLTDDFLNDVADAYRWVTETGNSPAPAIAEIAEVPVRTVHRWVYEARKRGILPPARAGRAG
ncbi:hypothetical protein [Streptomyces chartreusis]|uniref:hypothetical protein n=1 Tax=Streptomyces chartreusis TaxID=1969 RepID=UPI0036586FD6